MGWRDGLCSPCLQRGWDTLKISSQKLITERQAEAAEMFVVVRLFWLHQDDALGEKAWTHLNALINRALVPLKCSLTGAPQSFTSTDLIALRHWSIGMQNNNKNGKKLMRSNEVRLFFCRMNTVTTLPLSFHVV